MRIYNGTNSQVSLPYVGNQRINVAPKSVSGNIGCNADLLSLIVTSYTTDELAIIVSGPYELSMASQNPVAVGYVVQTLDEAITRFAKPSPNTTEEATVEPEPEPIIEEVPETTREVYETPKVEEVVEEDVRSDEESEPVGHKKKVVRRKVKKTEEGEE